MQILISLRWVLLGLALACALAFGLFFFGISPVTLPIEACLWAGGPLQALGVFAMHKHLATNGGWPVIVGYVAAALWIVAIWAAQAATAAGAGGLVYGLLVLFPSIGIAGVLQLIALIGFARRKPA